MNTEILKAAEKMVELLKCKNLKIATAESCTGGMVSAYITAVSGASQVFEMGVTSYSNRIKNEVLKVDNTILETKGAVSYETASVMAENIRCVSGADIGISVTGVAGPVKQDGHPVGTVFIAISSKQDTDTFKLKIEPCGRNFVREQTVLALINKVIKKIQ